MSLGVTRRVRTYAGVAIATVALCLPARAHAQTTLVLQAPDTDSVDTFIRGGSYAGKNYDGGILVTRASANGDYMRRTLLKFNTTRVPSGASISSAKLTLTVSGGYSNTRLLSAYRVASSWDEHVATWKSRYTSTAWNNAGGDVAGMYAQAYVSGPGTKVNFDVTKLVQATVNGSFGSRYTRIAIVDAGDSTNLSYREFYSSEASSSSVRPTLTVTYGGSSTSTSSSQVTANSTSTSTATSSSTSTSSLRVLQWNTHHGGIGTDGVYNPKRLAAWIAKINPQVVSLNEVDTTDELNAIVSPLDSYTGVTWHTSFSGRGNVILSRLAINNTSKCLYDPNSSSYAAHAGVAVNGRAINIWSTQLSVYSATDRLTEVKTMQSCASNWPEARLVVGDYNMQYGSTEYYAMANYYSDAWLAAKALGTATNYSGNCDGCTRNSRIDYAFSSKGASFVKVKSAQIFDTRDSSGVMPSDHKPMLIVYAVN